jgi:vacuolar-type H+-ATPase subunit I/STV1
MNAPLPTFRGRTLGITAIIALQIFIGVIHILFGFMLLASTQMSVTFSETSGAIYNVYTIAFGFVTTVFAVGIWFYKKWGIMGAILTSLFVAVVDSLTLLNLPSVPGIPKFAAFPEIIYSIFIMFYLLQAKSNAT